MPRAIIRKPSAKKTKETKKGEGEVRKHIKELKDTIAQRAASSTEEIADLKEQLKSLERFVFEKTAPKPQIVTPMKALKVSLWTQYGSTAYPAEWDGQIYGGGKISQRFWEYLVALDYLEGLGRDSVVADLGGGNEDRHFFASLLAPFVKKVYVVDPIARGATKGNIEFVQTSATDIDPFRAFIQSTGDITHLVSVSTFEHILDPLKWLHMHVVNKFCSCKVFVATFEFHPCPSCTQTFSSDVVHTVNLDRMARELTGFYLNQMSAAPLHCVNTMAPLSPWPKWYPIALQFLKDTVTSIRF